MIINSLGLKNIKSYGNNRQVITFDNKNPQLILLSGRNGSGKSTILEAIDLALFGKVKGKNKQQLFLTFKNKKILTYSAINLTVLLVQPIYQRDKIYVYRS